MAVAAPALKDTVPVTVNVEPKTLTGLLSLTAPPRLKVTPRPAVAVPTVVSLKLGGAKSTPKLTVVALVVTLPARSTALTHSFLLPSLMPDGAITELQLLVPLAKV